MKLFELVHYINANLGTSNSTSLGLVLLKPLSSGDAAVSINELNQYSLE